MTENQERPPGPGSYQLLTGLRDLRDHPHEYLLASYRNIGEVGFF